jgi:hypothetical protein
MAKKWLRLEAVRARYGDLVNRSIERAVQDGRLPAPQYPLGNRIPFWDEAKLDEHDSKIVTEHINPKPLARRNAETAAQPTPTT